MSEEDSEKSLEDLKKELLFYKSQTKVLRDKNRDLRNALLLAETQQPPKVEAETAQESLSDIRKIIADSKKQIADKLTQFKETIDESNSTIKTIKSPSSSSSSQGVAPVTPKFQATLETTSSKTEGNIKPIQTNISGDIEGLQKQCDYLKREVERLEAFVEQSEMVNERLRQLLAENSIDVSKITQAISEVSKTAITPVTPKIEISPSQAPQSRKLLETKQPLEPIKPSYSTIGQQQSSKNKLDPAIVRLFNDFRSKLSDKLNNDQIAMDILDLREHLMGIVPHSRIFYEMQVEYRKWKKGTTTIKELRDVLIQWENTIDSS